MARKVRVTPIPNKPAEKDLLALVATVAKPTQVESLKAFNAAILHFQTEAEVHAVFEHLQGKKIKNKELTVTLIGQADSAQVENSQQQMQNFQNNLDQVFRPNLLRAAVAGKSYDTLNFGMSFEQVKKFYPKITLQDWNKNAAEDLRFFSLKGDSLPKWKCGSFRFGKTKSVVQFLNDTTTPLLSKTALKAVMDEIAAAGMTFLFNPQDRLAAIGFVLSDEGPQLKDQSPLGLSRSQFQDFFAEDENLSSKHSGGVSLEFGLWAEFIDNLNTELLHNSRCSRLLMFSPVFAEAFFVKRPRGEAPRWDWFWSLIPVEASQSAQSRLKAIHQALTPLSREELLIFRDHLSHLVHQAYSPTIEGFARVTNQGATDDSYHDFAHWLISKGRPFFETALAGADKLAGENIEADIGEQQLLAAAKALYLKTFSIAEVTAAAKAAKLSEDVLREDAFITAPPPVAFAFPEVSNVQRDWDNEDLLEKTFPKLYKRFQ